MPKTPRLRELRERAALSQSELAERSGVSRATIADLEAGNRGAQPRTIRRLAQALGVAPEDLYGEPGYPLGEAPPALQESFNGLLEEERRRSRFANAISAAGDEWTRAVSGPDVNQREVWGIVEAALTLHDAISAPVDSEEEWEKLTNPERRELIAVLEKLNEVATSGVRQLEKTTEALDQEEKAKQNREKIREWTRKIA